MRVICDDCPFMYDDEDGAQCGMKYSFEIFHDEFGYVQLHSDSCRLVKIITLDGEILPEEVKE